MKNTLGPHVPLNLPEQDEQVAAAALYFASDESRFTTETELRIDGALRLLYAFPQISNSTERNIVDINDVGVVRSEGSLAVNLGKVRIEDHMERYAPEVAALAGS
jgi:hypothetical protein